MATAPRGPARLSLRRALISVSDKTGLDLLAPALRNRGIALLSTGGTAQHLRGLGVSVRDVSDETGFPEILDGRVKTLHPRIHGGLLARRDDPAHRADLEKHGIEGIDLLIVNLYPFEEARASGAAATTLVETIDIGGVALIRAAAKNQEFVTVIVEPADYEALLAELERNDGATTLTFRQALAAKAFARVAAYDAAIAGWLTEVVGEETPTRRVLAGTLKESLRYGENPHQRAALYLTGDPEPGVARATQLQGKALSYNNIADTDAAFALVCEFPPDEGPVVAIIKHANPCGVARGGTLAQAYERALACDPVSAFGGIIASNVPLDGGAAELMAKLFTEVIIAPGADADARAIIGKKKNLRLLVTGTLADPKAEGLSFRSIAGGFLAQTRDSSSVAAGDLKVVTRRAPSQHEMTDLLFAFTVAKHVKSNAVVFAKNEATVGIGAGQMSRLDSVRIAVLKARDVAAAQNLPEPATKDSVVASDAFFPFADGLVAAAEAGATAVIQPGGSVRDDEVIKAADAAHLAMVFTGQRHFRH
jgi:phosphoribosylaminoimidazolecarboxamide formyltransferase/IMP cyclohydrolase